MKSHAHPLIILIGGAAGTAKTSIAKQLCMEFDIAHRLGSGFIREISKSFVTPEENRFLYNYSFRSHIDISPFENLYKQSEVFTDAMNRCIKRAYDEGTSLVIEGVNVIPGLIDTTHVSLAVVLRTNDYNMHMEMISGKTHFKRKISESDFSKVREIQDSFCKKAIENDWPIVETGINDGHMKIIRNLIEKTGE